MKNIYCIVGPSGSGKTTISKILGRDYGMKLVESYTTRPPRYPNEEGHIFVSDEEFDALGEMCAYTEYDGHRYGVTPEVIDQNDIYVIDPFGVKYLRKHYHGQKNVVAIRLSVDEDTRMQRMADRGDSSDKIVNRIMQDGRSFFLEGIDNIDEIYEMRYQMLVQNYDSELTARCIATFIGCWEKAE